MDSLPVSLFDGKVCSRCGIWRSLDQYSPREDGRLKSHCKPCRRILGQAYKARNKEKVLEAAAAYRATRKAELAERERRWREEHPERYREIHAKWKSENKDAVNASTHRRRARIKGNGGTWTAEEWQALKERFDFRCLMCGRREPEVTLCFDHIVPVSEGGSNHIENGQPLCKPCNSKKHRSVLDLRGET